MKCRECGFTLGSHALYCPSCGSRQAPEERKADTPAPVPAGPPAAARKKGRLPQAGDIFADRFRVEKFLGQGSLCNTYLCRDVGAGNREVVLKIMHARKAAEPGMAESFLFLAESVAQYNHKGIARILESGSHGGAPYSVMEWVSGMPLRMWLLERLTFENRVLPGLGMIRSLLEIFQVIHERGCYGCLKPENVFVTLNGPVVADFGVVGFLSPQEFEFNSYARRYLPYMAPELKQDWSNLVPHSDYFSLGALLYEILVGRPPAPLLQLPSEMSDAFGIEADEIILKSMAARPLDRFGTLEAFLEAVGSLEASLLNAVPGGNGEPDPYALPALLEEPLAFHQPLAATTDAQILQNPEELFSTAESGASQDQPWIQRESPEGGAEIPWSPEPILERMPRGPKPAPVADPQAPVQGEEETLSAFAALKSREGEQAHAQRRFAHLPKSVLPERFTTVADGPSEGDARVTTDHPTAGGWDNISDEAMAPPAPDPDEPQAEPVPAWLWIALALAGSCMVVLSAYLGLFLPR